jgi:hypothetical protein
LLETVEVRRAETESRGDKRPDRSTVRHQQNGLAGVSREQMIPKQAHSIIKAENGVSNFIRQLHSELAGPEAPSAVLFGKAAGYFFKRQTFPVVKFDLSQPRICFELDFAVPRAKLL